VYIIEIIVSYKIEKKIQIRNGAKITIRQRLPHFGHIIRKPSPCLEKDLIERTIQGKGRGQSRPPNMVPFDMLGIVSY